MFLHSMLQYVAYFPSSFPLHTAMNVLLHTSHCASFGAGCILPISPMAICRASKQEGQYFPCPLLYGVSIPHFLQFHFGIGPLAILLAHFLPQQKLSTPLPNDFSMVNAGRVTFFPHKAQEIIAGGKFSRFCLSFSDNWEWMVRRSFNHSSRGSGNSVYPSCLTIADSRDIFPLQSCSSNTENFTGFGVNSQITDRDFSSVRINQRTPSQAVCPHAGEC